MDDASALVSRPRLERDWRLFPKFRHNLLTSFEEEPEVSYLTVSHSQFELPRPEADRFLQIRSYCTGHNTMGAVASRAGVPVEQVEAIVGSLAEADVLRVPYRPYGDLTPEHQRQVLLSACRIWSEQLAETGLAPKLTSGRLPRNVVLGWLLETYHYVKAFPDAVAAGARAASDPRLREVLETYAAQERGHEMFILRALTALGFSQEEVETSIPLVSTRLIDLLLREAFVAAPCTALLVAGVIEAGDLTPEESAEFFGSIASAYDMPIEAFAPVEEHMLVDARLGHAELPQQHADLIAFPAEDDLHAAVNRIHDIKHAFDLQALEIEEYYSRVGNYLPRQKVDFFSI